MQQGAERACQQLILDGGSALDRAVAAGRTGNVQEFLQELHGTGILDGLVRQLAGKWQKLDGDDVYDAIAQATDILYKNLVSGRQLINPGAFLWKTANNKADDSLPAASA